MYVHYIILANKEMQICYGFRSIYFCSYEVMYVNYIILANMEMQIVMDLEAYILQIDMALFLFFLKFKKKTNVINIYFFQ